VLNNPLRYTDPDGHGVLDVVGDAVLNNGTIGSRYHLMVMPDSVGWKIVEVPVGLWTMAVGVVDAAINVATLGGKSVITGTAKQVGKELLVKEGAEVARGYWKRKPRLALPKQRRKGSRKKEVKPRPRKAARPQVKRRLRAERNMARKVSQITRPK